MRPEKCESELLPDRHQPVESVENLLSEKGFCQPTFGGGGSGGTELNKRFTKAILYFLTTYQLF